jgi:oligosaccharide repeat unit polymerase
VFLGVKKMIMIGIIIIWWLFWWIISNFSITGIQTPSFETNFFVFIFLSSLIVGALMVKKIKYKVNNQELKNYKLFKVETILKVFNAIVLPVTLFFFAKALILFNTQGVENYRILVFSTAEHDSILFGSGPVQLLYSMIISPLIYVNIILSFILLKLKNKKKYIFLAFLVGALDAIMMLGRFYFYVFIFINFILNLATIHIKAKSSKKLILIAIIIVFSITITRSGKDTTFLDNIKRYVVEYHTIGFVLFDKALHNEGSYLNENIFFGRATFGSLERYIVLIIRRFDKSIDAALGDANVERAEFINISDRNSPPKYFNAFYTILYTLYIDGRIYGIIFGGLLLGYTVRFSYLKWKKQFNLFYLSVHLILVQSLIFSIFNSPIEAMRFGASLILLLAIFKIKFWKKMQNDTLTTLDIKRKDNEKNISCDGSL